MRTRLPRPRPTFRTAVGALAGVGLAAALSACGATAALGRTGQSGETTIPAAAKVTTTLAPTTTTVDPNGAPLAQPSSARPLTIVEIGDSLGEDLGFGLGDVFGSDPWVHVVQAAKGDTGLSRPDYYDWPKHVAALLQQYHPGLLVVFLGANDGQNFIVNGHYATVGDASWKQIYGSRAASVMTEAAAAGTRVLWVGMPIMSDPGFWQQMQMQNRIYQSEAAVHVGTRYFASWPLFSDSHGRYVESIGGVTLRAPDGIHIANGGDDRLARGLVGPIQQAWKITLFPPAAAG